MHICACLCDVRSLEHQTRTPYKHIFACVFTCDIALTALHTKLICYMIDSFYTCSLNPLASQGVPQESQRLLIIHPTTGARCLLNGEDLTVDNSRLFVSCYAGDKIFPQLDSMSYINLCDTV